MKNIINYLKNTVIFSVFLISLSAFFSAHGETQLASSPQAQSSEVETDTADHGLGVDFGTTGLGLFYDTNISSIVGFRGAYRSIEFDACDDFSSNDLTVAGYSSRSCLDINFSSVSYVFDIYFGSTTGFRFSLGGYTPVDLKVVTVSLSGGAGLDGDSPARAIVDYKLRNNILPYLGFGYTTHDGGLDGFKFVFDIGAIGSFELERNISCVNCTTEQRQVLVGSDYEAVTSGVEDIEFYPVINIGFKYQF